MITDMEDNDRNSHDDFFADRDWKRVANFWSSLMLRATLPDFVTGPIGDGYGLTQLQSIHALGTDEFSSNDPRYKRQTFAIRIGYDGSKYHGYQMQKGVLNVRTVESDVVAALGGRSCVAAGRTDKDVSAISQIISFSTYEPLTADGLLQSMRASPQCKSGSLAVWEVVRAPKRFHALFSASWRRYIYIFPTKPGPYEYGVDLDVAFVNRCLKQIEGLALPYNGFAFREDRGTEDSASDVCTLYKARAFLVDLGTGHEVCTYQTNTGNDDHLNHISDDSLPLALCVELVGSRFLRRMVRMLVSTAVRESVLSPGGDKSSDDRRDDSVLLKICRSRDRAKAAKAVPGIGLALCGVGYDAEQLSLKKHNLMRPGSLGSLSDCQLKSPNSDESGRSKNDNADSKRILFEANEDWLLGFRDSLTSRNPDLLYYPQRSFEFATALTGVSNCVPSMSVTPSQCRSSSMDLTDSRVAPEDTAKHLTILVAQSMAGVGSTVWDAEIILAHYLHSLPSNSLASANILELGAGTAVAAILCLKKGAKVTVQELADVLPHTLNCLEMNNVTASNTIASPWGRECIQRIRALCCPADTVTDINSSDCTVWETGESLENKTGPSLCEGAEPKVEDKLGKRKRKKALLNLNPTREIYLSGLSSDRSCTLGDGEGFFDRIIMADVLYHLEDFGPLVSTVIGCIAPKGVLVVCYEQRRKNLDPFFNTLTSLFHSHEKHIIEIERQSDPTTDLEGRISLTTIFGLHVFRSRILKP